MAFGYWAIITGIVCLVGFTYLVVLSLGEDDIK